MQNARTEYDEVASIAARARIAVLALFGYAVMLATLSFALLSVIVVAWIVVVGERSLTMSISMQLAGVLALPLFFVVRGFWINIEPPTGIVLTPERCALLHQTLNALGVECGAARIHRVVLNGDFAVKVAHTPRAGLFFSHHNTLVLGLPLLMSLSAEHARAIVAHELAHVCKRNGFLSRRLCRIREIWSQIGVWLQTTHGLPARVLSPFSGWFVPRLDALSTDLLRAQAFRADSIAAELTSPNQVASALLSARLLSELIEERYWHDVFGQTRETDTPIKDPYRGLARFLGTLDCNELCVRARTTLHGVPLPQLTSPSLGERIDAMRAPSTLPGIPAVSAAEVWFAGEYQAIISAMEAHWRERHAAAWRERHNEVALDRKSFESLSARAAVSTLSPPEYLKLAKSSETHAGAKQAVQHYRTYLKQCPKDTQAQLALGRLLLPIDEPKGVEILALVARHCDSCAPRARELLSAHYMRQGDHAGAQHWQDRSGWH